MLDYEAACRSYRYGRDIHLDVDGENYPDEFGLDAEAVAAVEEHSGRRRG